MLGHPTKQEINEWLFHSLFSLPAGGITIVLNYSYYFIDLLLGEENNVRRFLSVLVNSKCPVHLRCWRLQRHGLAIEKDLMLVNFHGGQVSHCLGSFQGHPKMQKLRSSR